MLSNNNPELPMSQHNIHGPRSNPICNGPVQMDMRKVGDIITGIPGILLFNSSFLIDNRIRVFRRDSQ